MKYIVRISLLKLPVYGKTEALLSVSSEYENHEGATALFQDLMRQMPDAPNINLDNLKIS